MTRLCFKIAVVLLGIHCIQIVLANGSKHEGNSLPFIKIITNLLFIESFYDWQKRTMKTLDKNAEKYMVGQIVFTKIYKRFFEFLEEHADCWHVFF